MQGGEHSSTAMHVNIGDTVRLPGFPAVLTVEDISGALGMVCWRSTTGDVIRGEVFLSQLEPADWYQGKADHVAEIGMPALPPFREEKWDPPVDLDG
jgi:hypothetical protein